MESGWRTRLLQSKAFLSSYSLEALATNMCVSPGTIVTSDEAAVVRNKIWAEITSILQNIDPDLRTQF